MPIGEGIIGPYCGFDDGDDRYEGEGCYECFCGRCGGKYRLLVRVSLSYETTATADPKGAKS